MLPAAVIPARYASTRFPGKPLALLRGKPMVQHVHERCVESGAFSRVLVATEDERIARAVRSFGGEVAMTSAGCATGTDRVAEVARQHPGLEVLVNVQGDEPALHPSSLAALAEAFADPAVQMCTLVRPLESSERADPAVVKAVVAQSGWALYFSRADVPFRREGGDEPPRWGHLGIYGYRRRALLELAALPPSPLERAECLEQLRALEHGLGILCVQTPHGSVAVDRPEDVPRAEAALGRLLG